MVLDGELLGINGVCGVPLTVGVNGWRAEPLDWLARDEIDAIEKATKSIQDFISGTLIEGVKPTLLPEALLVV